MKNKLPLRHFLAIVFVFSGFIFHYGTLYEGHNWGGDFSQYILHAKNMAHFQPYAADIMLDLPVIYPPGFPLILAPLVKLFGVNFIVLKAFVMVLWLLTSWMIYRQFEQKFGYAIGLGILILLMCSAEFFLFKQNVLSDIPFYFWVTAFLIAFERRIQGFNIFVGRDLFLPMGLLIMAILTRSAGWVLWLSVLIWFVIHRRNRTLIVVLCTGLLAVKIQVLFTGIHGGFVDQFTNVRFLSVGAILTKMWVPVKSMCSLMIPFRLLENPGSWPAWLTVIFLSALLIIIFRAGKKNFQSVAAIFSILYIILLLVWVGTPIPTQGFWRLTLPLIYPVLYFGLEGLRQVSGIKFRAIVMGLLAGCVILNLVAVNKYDDYHDDVLNQSGNQELFQWVRLNLNQGDHYLFWEPRVMSLMTGRVGTVPTVHSRDGIINLPERIRAWGIDYIIAMKGIDQAMIHSIDQAGENYKLVWEGTNYLIYQAAF